MITFRCLDCGRRVVSYNGEVGIAHCASCAWITKYVPPEHQADARERLGVPLARGTRWELKDGPTDPSAGVDWTGQRYDE